MDPSSNGSDIPDDVAIALRLFGLQRIAELFPADVMAAWGRAQRQRAELDAPDDPARDPWPPMQCLS